MFVDSIDIFDCHLSGVTLPSTKSPHRSMVPSTLMLNNFEYYTPSEFSSNNLPGSSYKHTLTSRMEYSVDPDQLVSTLFPNKIYLGLACKG